MKLTKSQIKQLQDFVTIMKMFESVESKRKFKRELHNRVDSFVEMITK